MTDILRVESGPDELRLLNQAYPERYPFLLQSTAGSGSLGRFDILFANPGESLSLDANGKLCGAHGLGHLAFLDALDAWWSSEGQGKGYSQLPFLGGWFVYLGYELAAEIEPRLRPMHDPLLPRAFAVRCPSALIFDHHAAQCHLLCEHDAAAFFRQVVDDIALSPVASHVKVSALTSVCEDPPEQFLAAVEDAKRHIEAGDVYQANLSRNWSANVADELTAERIYAALCAENPGPFAGIAHWHGTAIISSSPERLLRVRDGEISTRPIAGTRRRGDNATTDDELSSELLTHPKELAEHVMLIDLERNDLGRVCEPGSVEVNEKMILESYAHVHHIVSNIRGKLRAEVTPGQAIAAVFPGGTITGCPKVRCMEIISDLETAARGAYTGSFGYLNGDGSMDMNILIRTIVKRGNNLRFRAGAGIVADSIPYAELDETRAKAEGILRALYNG